MFAATKFYIIVGNNSFIIKKEGSDSENLIELQSFIPNVPCYYHLFDQDKKDYIDDISKQIKKLKIKNTTIILPDDSIDIEVDKRLLIEFFRQLGIKKVETSFQCFHLSLDSKKYISISKTSRVTVMQYITYNKSISKKYYDKNYINLYRLR